MCYCFLSTLKFFSFMKAGLEVMKVVFYFFKEKKCLFSATFNCPWLCKLLSFYPQGEVKKIDSNISSACGCTHYICGNFFHILSCFSLVFSKKISCKESRNRAIITFSSINTPLTWFHGCLLSYASTLSFLNTMLCLLTHPFCVCSGGV